MNRFRDLFEHDDMSGLPLEHLHASLNHKLLSYGWDTERTVNWSTWEGPADKNLIGEIHRHLSSEGFRPNAGITSLSSRWSHPRGARVNLDHGENGQSSVTFFPKVKT
jgi:hypothetical protein